MQQENFGNLMKLNKSMNGMISMTRFSVMFHLGICFTYYELLFKLFIFSNCTLAPKNNYYHDYRLIKLTENCHVTYRLDLSINKKNEKKSAVHPIICHISTIR